MRQGFEVGDHARPAHSKAGQRFELHQRVACRIHRQGQTQVANGLFEHATQPGQIEAVARRGHPFKLRIACQFEQLRRRHAVAKNRLATSGN
jgi:hypothetical protein